MIGKVLIIAITLVFCVLTVVGIVNYDPKRDGRCDMTKCDQCPFPCERHNEERK